MRLLLDQGLPRTAADHLNAAGIDAIHVAKAGYAIADDRSILQLAMESNRVVVTLDADFHSLLVLSGAVGPSVIRIRIEGLRAEALCRLLIAVVSQCDNDLKLGAMVTVTEDRLRIRRLPFLSAGNN